MIEQIDYLEYPAKDLAATKAFFTAVFAWQFTDYGPDYTAFAKQGLAGGGGFYRADKASLAENGAALTVFLTNDLAAVESRIIEAGGVISTPTFEFPGGKRFHFIEPSGNEFAVWAHTG